MESTILPFQKVLLKTENISNNEEISLAVIVNISITNKLEREKERVVRKGCLLNNQ